MSWPGVVQEASRYVEPLASICPRYVEEMRGVATGAQVPFLDVLALNVRTEIVFGLFRDASGSAADVPVDGCTSLGWLTPEHSFLGQNWDWMVEQAPNVVVLRLSQPDTHIPDIAMVTEAGIIGKFGLNAEGVGCCLNAIRCRGADRFKLPIHLALRTVLESTSREEAVQKLRSVGVAGSGHILIGDPSGSTGLECTSAWVKEIDMEDGRVYHSNHLTLDHADVDEPPWLPDSPARLARIRELTSDMTRPTTEKILEVFKDVDGFPAAINRKQEGGSTAETLFTIIMDLKAKTGQVTFGRPSEYSEQTILAF